MALQCVVVTPEETLLDETCDFVALPLYDGEIGIATGHSPLIGRLGYGELRLRAGGGDKRYYVDGGFVQVANNVVSVLTNRALTANDIDGAAAEELLKAASQLPASNEEELSIKERQIAQARAQIRMAGRR